MIWSEHRPGGRWTGRHEPLLHRVFVVYVLGCAIGALFGLLPLGLPDQAIWHCWLTGQSAPYGKLLLRMLRFPVFLYLCASARTGIVSAYLAIGAHGAVVSYTTCCLVQREGSFGWLIAGLGQAVCGLLLAPLLFQLAVRCILRRRIQPLDGWTFRNLLLLLGICAVLSAVEYLLISKLMAFLLWISR